MKLNFKREIILAWHSRKTNLNSVGRMRHLNSRVKKFFPSFHIHQFRHLRAVIQTYDYMGLPHPLSDLRGISIFTTLIVVEIIYSETKHLL